MTKNQEKNFLKEEYPLNENWRVKKRGEISKLEAIVSVLVCNVSLHCRLQFGKDSRGNHLEHLDGSKMMFSKIPTFVRTSSLSSVSSRRVLTEGNFHEILFFFLHWKEFTVFCCCCFVSIGNYTFR